MANKPKQSSYTPMIDHPTYFRYTILCYNTDSEGKQIEKVGQTVNARNEKEAKRKAKDLANRSYTRVTDVYEYFFDQRLKGYPNGEINTYEEIDKK